MGEFLKAKKLYEKALKIKDKQLGEFNCETAISFNNLGNVSRCLNEYANAEGFYFQALNFYKSVSTNEIHPNYGPTIGNLGLVQKDLGTIKKFFFFLILHFVIQINRYLKN